MKMPKTAIAAAIVTIALAALTAFRAITSRDLIDLLPLPVFVIGAIGILRRTAWSAYGLALYEAAGVFLLALAKVRHEAAFAPGVDLAGAIFSAGVGILFFAAGRALEKSRGRKGHPIPWIVFTAVVSAPFVFFQFFFLPTGSMEPTLLIGDRMLVQRWPASEPKRGEMVVYRYLQDGQQVFLKRVEGIPGDRIKIVNKQLWVNGAPVEEPYVIHKTDYVDDYRDNFPGVPNHIADPAGFDMVLHHSQNGEIAVPAGNYFVLGDNRDNSFDSRFTGFVAARDIIGKPVMIYWSAEMPAGGQGPAGATRWNRVFKIL